MNKALIVIDVQESFRQMPSWAARPRRPGGLGPAQRAGQCCETTARVAADLGYRVTFVIDATATSPIEHRDAPRGRSLAEILADPRTLSVDEIIARTEYALAGRFAAIATVAELASADLTGAAAGG
jgi:Isochorismatase family